MRGDLGVGHPFGASVNPIRVQITKAQCLDAGCQSCIMGPVRPDGPADRKDRPMPGKKFPSKAQIDRIDAILAEEFAAWVADGQGPKLRRAPIDAVRRQIATAIAWGQIGVIMPAALFHRGGEAGAAVRRDWARDHGMPTVHALQMVNPSSGTGQYRSSVTNRFKAWTDASPTMLAARIGWQMVGVHTDGRDPEHAVIYCADA